VTAVKSETRNIRVYPPDGKDIIEYRRGKDAGKETTRGGGGGAVYNPLFSHFPSLSFSRPHTI
jgi:hypothetical protein